MIGFQARKSVDHIDHMPVFVCIQHTWKHSQGAISELGWFAADWVSSRKKKADTNMQHYVVCGLELWIPRNLPIVIPETSNIFGGTIIFGCTFNMYC